MDERERAIQPRMSVDKRREGVVDEARGDDREEADVGDAQHGLPLPGLSEEDDAAEDEGDADGQDRAGPGGERKPAQRVGPAQDSDHQAERQDDRGRGQNFRPRGRTCGWLIRRHRGALAPERPREQATQPKRVRSVYTRKIDLCGDFPQCTVWMSQWRAARGRHADCYL